jgi:hypothetical protein
VQFHFTQDSSAEILNAFDGKKMNAQRLIGKIRKSE